MYQTRKRVPLARAHNSLPQGNDSHPVSNHTYNMSIEQDQARFAYSSIHYTYTLQLKLYSSPPFLEESWYDSGPFIITWNVQSCVDIYHDPFSMTNKTIFRPIKKVKGGQTGNAGLHVEEFFTHSWGSIKLHFRSFVLARQWNYWFKETVKSEKLQMTFFFIL